MRARPAGAVAGALLSCAGLVAVILAGHAAPVVTAGTLAPSGIPGGVTEAGLGMPLATPLLVPSRPGAPVAEVAAAQVPPPVRLQIPAIRVDARLGQVGLQPDGTIAVPADWNQPAWYRDGATPGEQGPAVIVGHLDSNTGPAVFWRLARLRPGDTIAITRQDGSMVSYKVTGVGTFARAAFPTQAVYGPTTGSALRLITCGGSFDWSAHRYTDNVVVFAEAS